MPFNAEDYNSLLSKTGGLQEAINATPLTGGIVKYSENIELSATVRLKNGIYLEGSPFAEISADASTAIVGENVTDVALSKVNICKAMRSGIWFSDSNNILVEKCIVQSYNVLANVGHAGIAFIGSTTKGKILNCTTLKGNGNGIRVHYAGTKCPSDITIEGCNIEDAFGTSSSEGVTLCGRDITFKGNRIKNANVWGALVWGAKSLELYDIDISYNQIMNSSQNLSWSHSAIFLAVNDGIIHDVYVECNIAYDVGVPTQQRLLIVNDNGLGGTIKNLYIQRNENENQLSPNPVLIFPTVKQVNVTSDVPIVNK